jgi:hypothetical protein
MAAVVALILLFGLPILYVIWAVWFARDPTRQERLDARMGAFYAALDRTIGVYIRVLFWVVVFAVALVVGFNLIVGSSVVIFDWINSLTVPGLLMIIAVLLLLVLLLLLRQRR